MKKKNNKERLIYEGRLSINPKGPPPASGPKPGDTYGSPTKENTMLRKPDVYETTCPECHLACRYREHAGDGGKTYELHFIPLEDTPETYPVCSMCGTPVDKERCTKAITLAQTELKGHQITVMEGCQLVAGHDGVHIAEGKSHDTQERYRIMWGFENSDN